MKALTAIAFLFPVGFAVPAAAAPLPQPMSLIQRHKVSNVTHFVRGATQKLPAAIGLESRDRHRTVRQTHAVRGR